MLSARDAGGNGGSTAVADQTEQGVAEDALANGAATSTVEPPAKAQESAADAEAERQAEINRIVDERLKRDRATRDAATLKRLGVERIDDAEAIIKAHREKVEAEKSEAEKLAEQLAAEQAARSAAEAKAAELERRTSYLAALGKVGIRDLAEKALRLTDWPDDDSEVDYDALAKATAEANPFLVDSQTAQAAPGTRAAIGRQQQAQAPAQEAYASRLAAHGFKTD